jgi:uncharacterized protein (UPF0332 family)
MALHHELLQLARFLANREPKHPRQVSLRRALSTAYYALFHTLIAEASSVLAPSQPSGLRAQIGRAFAHADMKAVCTGFSQGNVSSLSAATGALIVPLIRQELRSVALAFIDLYGSRHSADYDTLATPFSKTDVVTKIQEVEQSLTRLEQIRGESNSNVFLAALCFQKHWAR